MRRALLYVGNGVDEDGECEPEEYTDLEDDEVCCVILRVPDR